MDVKVEIAEDVVAVEPIFPKVKMDVKVVIAEDVVAVEPIVQEVLQEPPADPVVAGLDTTEASTVEHASETPSTTPPVDATTPVETAPTQPAPEQSVEAASAPGDAVKAAEESPAAPMVEGDATAKPDAAATPANDAPKKTKRKETRKRVRRVGKSEPRKFAKVEASSTNASGTTGGAEVVLIDGMTGSAPQSEGTGQTRRVLSKHDEKWNNMFTRLLEYKKANSHTLVPQCYHDDPRLGRWVHYQRVEYWIYQQQGTGKITPERIGRLESIGFEWDPQKAQWNIMFDRLVKFKEEVGHCKVPKGYAKDTELANWVRNQRLEQANFKKNKKSRMTQGRYEKLTTLGFRWSTSIAKKGSARKPASSSAELSAATSVGAVAASEKEDPTDEKEDPTEKSVEEAVAVAIDIGESTARDTTKQEEEGEDQAVIQI